MEKTFDIVAYTYQADTYCPECIVKVMNWSPMADRASAEMALDDIAMVAGIDRYNETAFDSNNFPKVVSRGEFSGIRRDFCGGCNKEIP